jgi:hypothetical protein
MLLTPLCIENHGATSQNSLMGVRGIFVGAAMMGTAAATTSTGAQEMSLVCTNAGNVYKVGEFACVAACHGARRLALCDLVLKTATWTYVSEVCPSARFVPGPPADASQVPTVVAMSPLPGPLKISEIAANIAPRIWRAALSQ